MHNLIDLVTGKPRQGRHGLLTVNPGAQKAAYQALKAEAGQRGAVAIDPKTGAILALASYPVVQPEQAGHAQRQAAEQGRQEPSDSRAATRC